MTNMPLLKGKSCIAKSELNDGDLQPRPMSWRPRFNLNAPKPKRFSNSSCPPLNSQDRISKIMKCFR